MHVWMAEMCLKLFCKIQNRRKFVLREQCSFDHGSNHMFTIYTQKNAFH